MEAGVVAVVERHPQPVQDLGEIVLLIVAPNSPLTKSGLADSLWS